MPHALIVDDDLSFLVSVSELVRQEEFTVDTASTLKEARAKAGQHRPDVLLIDLMLPDGSGIDFLKDLETKSDLELILMTGHASVDSAVEALRIGVTDYLTKPVDQARLKTVLVNVRRTRELKEEIGTLRDELRKLGRFGPLIGAATPMQKLYDLISRVATTEATVFVTGESGTGKELVAQTLHRLSKRRSQPFLPINCGAIPATLIESALFGHEQGSFTGASRTHKGYFERASGGTLFLDEITEMPFELQVKLLRVLETGTIMRIGSDRQIEVDVRVITASNRDPDEAVQVGKLREDLLYRLKVFPINVPPLRDRGTDVDLLGEYFLGQLNQVEGTDKRFSKQALERLRGYTWPGNVRQLKNVVHRAFILAEDEISADCLPTEVGDVRDPASPSLHFKVGSTLAEVERRLILATVAQYEDSRKEAAKVLGISLKTLYNRLRSYAKNAEGVPTGSSTGE